MEKVEWLVKFNVVVNTIIIARPNEKKKKQIKIKGQ